MLRKVEVRQDWRWVIKRAWSFRLLALAALLESASVIIPLFANEIPRTTFSILILIVIAAAMVARVIAQKRD